MVEMYRQGDVLFIKVEHVEGIKKKSKIIQEGESTGHAHQIMNGNVFGHSDIALYIEAFDNAIITHEEHGTIPIPKGNYRVIRQREFVPLEKRKAETRAKMRYVSD